MKTRRSKLGLSILAGGMSFVGAANAVDLIVNGSFENPAGSEWKYYQTYNYSQVYFTPPAVPASENPGTTWSWRHASANGAWGNFVTPTNEVDHLQFNLQWADSQTVNLTNAIAGVAIDAGLGQYSFSAWLTSYTSNPEQPYLVLRFFDEAGTNQLGPNVIFDRTSNVNALTYADGTIDIQADLSQDHSWIKYAALANIPANARKATVYITRSPNAGVSNSPDTYVDLVKLDVINVNDTTVLNSAFPSNGQTGVSPDAALSVALRDVNTQVNTNSIQLSFDGSQVIPSVTKAGAITTVQYDPPGLLAPFVNHKYKILWKDNGAVVTTKTNEFSFTVVPYQNINLGQPIYLETFDGVAEGSLPAGWSVKNFTDPDLPGNDLNDFHSDAYLDWVVISRNTLSNLFTVVPGGADFANTLSVAPGQVINNALVTNLVEGNFIFAVSDRANNQEQIQYLYTRDYDLSGKTSVYLSFHSLWTQNQDSMASLEYSTDGGATWLPALYLLDGPDILLNRSGGIDASNTFATIHGDVPNLDAGTIGDGNYGQFIGVNSNQWATLAPYLSARVDDNGVESKRVEVIRLAQADNKSTVRFRLTNMGTYSWYWGIDNLGLYSIPNVDPPVLASAPSPVAQTAAAGNSTSFSIASAVGLGPFTYQWRLDGANLPGKTEQTLSISAVQPSDAGTYDVVVSNSGGSVTSPPPAAVLTVINPTLHVTGQWDFLANLKATVGSDLEYFDAAIAADTTFGTTTSFGIADINGQSTSVMHFTPSLSPWGGYKMFHGAAANGGGAYVNQFTLIYDLFYPDSVDRTWRSLLQTGTGNDSDGDLFLNTANGIGISQVYEGVVSSGTWHRIAIAFDLTGPGSPVLTKFIDGVKVGNQTTGLSGKDGRFALDPYALIFADNDGDQSETYVSSVQFSDGRRPDSYLRSLGGASASKIPGFIGAALEGGKVVIRWTGGVPLQSADSPAGPWDIATGATSPYTPPAGSDMKFYRPKML